jgi:sulfonate transport system ATP-binding protein
MGENKRLIINHVKKVFPLENGNLEVLSDINLEIEDGEFISIVGASGCGKSTLLRIIAGLERASEGEVTIGDRKVEAPSVETGMIFQESRLFPWLNVAQNIEFGIHKNLSKDFRYKLIREHIELVKLNGFEKALPRQLSGGMQQRVSIARALINQPSVLLLDEPFGALDALTRINMQNEVLRIWQAEQTTMILITHDIDEAIFLSDRIIIMSDRPGVIKKIILVPMARPRDRSSLEFMKIRKEIYSEFFEDSNIAIDYYL